MNSLKLNCHRKKEKRYPNFGNMYLICVHLWVNSRLKCSFKSILKKKRKKIFPADLSFVCRK